MANASDNIQVAIRIRPLIKSEKEKNLPIQWGVQRNNIYQIDENGQRNGELYSFDHIFRMSKSNLDIYEEIVKDFIDSALNGLNSTIFAYGQTSSGKTYTMLGTDGDRGLVPLTIDSIFDAVSEIRDRKFLLRVSYVEIYNERINDLLDPSNTDVKIREFSSGTIGLQSVKEEIVSKRERVFELLKIGARNKHMGSTSSNERSSRSHSIFKIVIESVDFDDKDMPVQISSINLVDLAGSERVAHTKATGMQLKEGGHINKSLSALGLVIRQLSDGQEFANFRDSKLTRLLQHSLGGNAKTLIICTITLTSLEYTTSTLSFAQRAKAVKNKPQINEVIPDSATCKHYALMNTQLKERLQEQLKKNQDLERDKENNSREISRLREQMLMLDMFLHGKERDSAITIPKRRHTIGHPGKAKPLKLISEELEDVCENIQECSTSVGVPSLHIQSWEREHCKEFKDSVRDDGNGFNETLIKAEELETETEATNSVTKNLQKLEEPLIVVQLNNKFKKREEELLNKIRSLEEQLKDKEGKTEEKHDISISTDMQYLQDQLIILQGILKKNNLTCDFSEKVVLLEEQKVEKSDPERNILDVKEDFEKEKNELKSIINKLEEDKRSLLSTLQNYNEDRKKSELDDCKSHSDNETKALKLEIDRLNKLMLDDKVTIKRLTSVIEQFKTDSDKNTQVLTEMRETNNNYVDKIKLLEDQIKHLKINESKIACLNCDIAKYKHQVREYSAALEELTDINKKLKNEVANIQKKHELEVAKISQKLEKSEKDLKKLQENIVTIDEKKTKPETLNEKLYQTLYNIIEKFIEEEKVLLSVKVPQDQKDSLKNARKEMKDIYMNLKNQMHLFREKSGYDIYKINELLINSYDTVKMFFTSAKQLHELDLSRKEYEISVLKEFNKNGCPSCNAMKVEVADLKIQINSQKTQLTETLAKLRNSQEALLSTGRQSLENTNKVCSSCEDLKKRNKNLEEAYHDKDYELFKMQMKLSKEKEKRDEIHRSEILDAYRDIERDQQMKIADQKKIIEDQNKTIEDLKKLVNVNKKTVGVQCEVEEVGPKSEEIENLHSKYEKAKNILAQRRDEIETLKEKLKQCNEVIKNLNKR